MMQALNPTFARMVRICCVATSAACGMACAVAADATQIQPTHLAGKPAVQVVQAAPVAQGLRPLSLQDAYTLALERDTVYLAARAQHRATRERLPQARALLRPSVALSASLTSSVASPRSQTWLNEPVEVQSSADTTSTGTTTESSTSTTSGTRSEGASSATSTGSTSTGSSTFNQSGQQTSARGGHASEWERMERRTRGSQADAEINLTWPLYRPALQRGVEQSELLDEQGNLRLEAARQDVAVRVVQAYFDVVLAKEVLVALKAQERALRQQLEGAESSFEQGVVTIADVREAKANLDLVLAQQVVQQNQWKIKRAALQSLIGIAVGDVRSMRSGDPAPMFSDAGGVEYWIGMAEANAFEIRVQDLALQAARKELDKQKAAHKPTLDFVANVGTQVARDRSRSTASTTETYAGHDSSHAESQRDTRSETDVRTRLQTQVQSVSDRESERSESSVSTSSDTTSQSETSTRTYRPASEGRTRNRQWDMYLGFRLNVPLTDGGLTRSREREALALQEVQEADLQRAKAEAALAAQTAYLEWMGFTAELGALKAAEASSLVALEANLMGYEVGLKTNSDVLNVQQQLFAVRRDMVKARINTLLAWVRLKASVGKLGGEDVAHAAMELEGSP
jgi:outer membrane protein